MPSHQTSRRVRTFLGWFNVLIQARRWYIDKKHRGNEDPFRKLELLAFTPERQRNRGGHGVARSGDVVLLRKISRNRNANNIDGITPSILGSWYCWVNDYPFSHSTSEFSPSLILQSASTLQKILTRCRWGPFKLFLNKETVSLGMRLLAMQ